MNNTGILTKCLEELSKESPRLDYIRGMLETLVSLQSPLLQADTQGKITLVPPAFNQEIDTPLPPTPDLNHIKAIAEQSFHD